MIKKTSEKPTRSMLAFRKTLVEICRNKTVDEIALKDLCKVAGFTAMAFYYCYDDKHDLAKDIIDSEIINLKNIGVESVSDSDPDNPEKSYLSSLASFYEYIKENADLYRCIIKNKLMPNTLGYVIDELVSYFKENMHFTKDIGEENPGYSDLMVKIRYTEMFTIIGYWLDRDCDISAAKLAELTNDLLRLQVNLISLN